MAKVGGNGSLTALKKANLPMIIVAGGPGSGKGTQCDKIKAKYGYAHLSTGDLLRDEVKSGSSRGKAINETMASGQLVPMELVITLLKEAMLKAFQNKTKGFLIDGFPRDVAQAEALTKQVGLPKVVLFFDCQEEVLMKRIIERGKSSGRIDDNPESIKQRISVFNSQTKPVIAYYEKQKLVKKIAADRDVDSIFSDVSKVLDTK